MQNQVPQPAAVYTSIQMLCWWLNQDQSRMTFPWRLYDWYYSVYRAHLSRDNVDSDLTEIIKMDFIAIMVLVDCK